MRVVKCVVGTYVSVVDDNECNAATRPTDTQVNPVVPVPPGISNMGPFGAHISSTTKILAMRKRLRPFVKGRVISLL